MTSISSPPFTPPLPTTTTTHLRSPKTSLNFRHSSFLSSSRTSTLSSTICRCNNQDPKPPPQSSGGDSSLHNVAMNIIKNIEGYLNLFFPVGGADDGDKLAEKQGSVGRNVGGEVEGNGEGESEEWDWERWKKHFEEIDQQEKIASVLKAQLGDAVRREDYDDAARLKVAIAAAATNDTVGLVITQLNRALQEERYQDATSIRDYAGAGLVGWWSGISEDSDDPYGRIIRIKAEHGRYVARSYSPRHLGTIAPGVPLFEIFLTASGKSKYKKKAVYLKRLGGNSNNLFAKTLKSSGSSTLLNPISGSIEAKSEFPTISSENTLDTEDKDDDDSDTGEEFEGFPRSLQDMIPPGAQLIVLQPPEKEDMGLISDMSEQIIEDKEDEEDQEEEEEEEEVKDYDGNEAEDEKKDVELEGSNKDDEGRIENNLEKDDNEIDVGEGFISNSGRQNEVSVKVVIGHVEMPPSKALVRVPAKLEQKGRLSFSFSIENDDLDLKEVGVKGNSSPDKNSKIRGRRNFNSVISDLGKSMNSRKRIPMKLLKDVEELINFSLNQAKNRPLLSGTTTFNRIEIPASPDLLSGLYVGAQGLNSEVIHLKRKFGQWQEDSLSQELPNLEFYEYVEALKLTGDPQVPAGQVAFRAKIGKQYLLPHTGIIPKEFGVVARYKGQGRLAEPGFKNPRWVDGELVILDGKYIKEGPVVGFVYWAPDYHFLVFFNRVKLQE